MDDAGQFAQGDATQQPQQPQRRRVSLAIAVFVLVLVGGLLLAVGISRQEPAPPARPEAGGGPAAASGRATATPPKGDSGENEAQGPMARSDPVRVSIPSIDVSSSLEKLGLDEKKAMETPRDPAKAGWYEPGPTPGAIGPAVIAGHVTWNGTPSVFFKLAKLKAGDTIGVRREDGATAEFTVDRVAQYPKDEFPTIDVYRNLDYAGLRLITCGGDYSQADRRYADNVVVYATLTGTLS